MAKKSLEDRLEALENSLTSIGDSLKNLERHLTRKIQEDGCFECGAPAEHQHHVIPRSLGGRYMVPLCMKCHGIVHDLKVSLNHAALTKEGLRKARERGAKIGRPRVGIPVDEIYKLWETGLYSMRGLAEKLGIGAATAHRAVQEHRAAIKRGDAEIPLTEQPIL